VPLSAWAPSLLQALPREGDFIFPGQQKGAPLSSIAMTKVLKRMGRNEVTVRGFRSSFRDWANARDRDHRRHNCCDSRGRGAMFVCAV
jgi:hypothetical protein